MLQHLSVDIGCIRPIESFIRLLEVFISSIIVQSCSILSFSIPSTTPMCVGLRINAGIYFPFQLSAWTALEWLKQLFTLYGEVHYFKRKLSGISGFPAMVDLLPSLPIYSQMSINVCHLNCHKGSGILAENCWGSASIVSRNYYYYYYSDYYYCTFIFRIRELTGSHKDRKQTCLFFNFLSLNLLD